MLNNVLTALNNSRLLTTMDERAKGNVYVEIFAGTIFRRLAPKTGKLNFRRVLISRIAKPMLFCIIFVNLQLTCTQ